MKDVGKVNDDVMGISSRPSMTEMVNVATEYGIRRHPLMIEAYLSFTFYLIRHAVVNNVKLEVANIDTLIGVRDSLSHHRHASKVFTDIIPQKNRLRLRRQCHDTH